MTNPICVACGDTGKNSRGNPCWPCQAAGRLGLFAGEDKPLVATATPRPQTEVKFDYKITMGDSVGDGSPAQERESDSPRRPSVPAVSPTPPPPLTDAQEGAETF